MTALTWDFMLRPPPGRRMETDDEIAAFASYQERLRDDYAASAIQGAWLDRFRVVVLHPASSFEDDLVCNLRQGRQNFVVNEDSSFPLQGDYEALSYTWGSSTSTAGISVDGTRRHITENLDVALRYLRLADRVRCLWVDALCIDQDDNADKEMFVARMHLTYRAGSRTIVWLGEASDGSDEVLNAFESIAKGASSPLTSHKGDYMNIPSSAEFSLDEKQLWTNANHFADRPWWRRVWVMQEVVWSNHRTAQCGHHQIPWMYLIRALALLQEKIAIAIETVDGCGSLVNLLSVFEMVPRHTFAQALDAGRRRAATDLRDKVYGQLHLQYQTFAELMSVDYSKSVAEVYADAAISHLSDTKDLEILAMCDFISEDEPIREEFQHGEIDGLPSWAPNWACGPRPFFSWNTPAERMDDAVNSVPYQATLRLFEHPSQEKGFAYDGEKFSECRLSRCKLELCVKAALFDSLRLIGPVYDIEGIEDVEDVVTTSVQLGFDAFPNIRKRKPYHYNGAENSHTFAKQIPDRVMRTLTGDRSLNRTRWSPPLTFDMHGHDASLVRRTISAVAGDRRFFVTTTGRFGLGPPGMKMTDLVTVVLGCSIPLVLRRINIRSCDDTAEDRIICHYRLIGTAYVEGIMDGELIPQMGSGEGYPYKIEEFVLR